MKSNRGELIEVIAQGLLLIFAGCASVYCIFLLLSLIRGIVS